jgi:glycosyltransferase involved in cell wall biosynthesis
MSDARTAEAALSPTVSVVVAAYNVAPYIGETLDSLVRQTYTAYEAIVVNDGSTDETERAVEPFRDRIVYVRQENRGPAAARNTGLRRARGRYVALLDGDDVWLPEYLEKLVALLEADPTIDLIQPNAVYFGSSPLAGRLCGDPTRPHVPATFERLLTLQTSIFISCIFKRQLAIAVGMFDEAVPRGVEDFDLWLRMAQRGARFAYTPEPLVKYRKRGGSVSSDEVRMRRNAIRVYEKWLADPSLTPRQHGLVRACIAEQEASISLRVAKQMILAHNFAAAQHELSFANARARRVKLALVAAALRVAPRLVAGLLARRQIE